LDRTLVSEVFFYFSLLDIDRRFAALSSQAKKNQEKPQRPGHLDRFSGRFLAVNKTELVGETNVDKPLKDRLSCLVEYLQCVYKIERRIKCETRNSLSLTPGGNE